MMQNHDDIVVKTQCTVYVMNLTDKVHFLCMFRVHIWLGPSSVSSSLAGNFMVLIVGIRCWMGIFA